MVTHFVIVRKPAFPLRSNPSRSRCYREQCQPLSNMRRTITSSQMTLQLPFPSAASSDFSDAPTIRITIPAGSAWQMPSHWYYHTLDAKSIEIVQNRVVISVDFIQGGGSSARMTAPRWKQDFDLSQIVMWRPSPSHVGLVVDLESNEALHRNICSVILDNNHYPRLASTPPWVKALFALSKCCGSEQQLWTECFGYSCS